MFLGEHFPRLDDKGRLVLPAKYREALSSGLVLAKGQDFSITVWPASEFAAYAAGLEVEAQSSARARATTRVLFSGAFDQIPDRQGRITVPASLREYAGLDRDVVFVGRNKTAEIWAVDAWRAYLTASESAYADMDEEAPSAQ